MRTKICARVFCLGAARRIANAMIAVLVYEFDLGKISAPIHFSINLAPIAAPTTPNAINHQVSMAIPSKIAEDANRRDTEIRSSFWFFRCYSIDASLLTNRSQDEIKHTRTQCYRNQNSEKPFDPLEISLDLSEIARRHAKSLVDT